MGSGKSIVGKALGEHTKIPFIDLDKYIEQHEGKTINEIFLKYGEQYFRDLEYKACKELCLKKGIILALGGGTPLYKRNFYLLKKNSKIVFLNVPESTITYRLENDNTRPLLNSSEKAKRIKKLYRERQPCYIKISDVTIDAQECVENIVNNIINIFDL